MQTQQYLIIMRDDTSTTEKTPIFLDRVRISNNVIDSCQKHYKIQGEQCRPIQIRCNQIKL